MEDIVYESAIIPEKLVSLSTGENKSKKVSKGNDKPTNATTTKKKVNDGKVKASGSSSTKKRKATKETPEKTNSAKKNKVSVKDGKVKAPGSSLGANGNKGSSPEKDASVGMKNLMAQFVKRSPVIKTASTPKDAKTSSSSQ